MDGVVGAAADLVGSGCPGLVANVLGSVVVVRDLAAAERLWSANGADTSFVTVHGELLSPPGALGGGRPGAARDASLLSRKRAIRDLTGEAAALDVRLAGALARSGEADAELAGLGAEQRAAAADRESAETARLTAAKDLEQVVREEERVAVLEEACRAERVQVEDELRVADAEIERSREGLGGVEAASTRVASAITAELTAIEMATAAETERAQAFLDAQVQLTALAGRIDGARTDVERGQMAEVDARDRIAAGEQRRVGLTARAEESRREHGRLTMRADEIRDERDRAETVAREAADLLSAASERARQVGEELRAAEATLGRASHAAHELAVQLTEVRVRREDLVHEARRQHEVTVDQLGAAHDPARDLEATQARLQAVTERIGELSPVNLVADDEYRELDERLAFLRTQHDDLTASMRDLDRALRGMTRTAQARFAEAFEAINRNFQELFTRLFEGGRAELRLVEAAEDGDPMETGIEMVAQPRGKRLQAISLLSGGEKALTGLALLFAIFYYRPSPFCLLDEVDAPLDDANIHRFTRVLRELAGHTQFVVITHNRKTMEAADVLYGITMEEPGLSRVVSVNLT
jgi:chromosome segregation protein